MLFVVAKIRQADRENQEVDYGEYGNSRDEGHFETFGICIDYWALNC